MRDFDRGLRYGHLTEMKAIHRNSDGNILWEQDWTPNALAGEGEKNILQAYLQGQAVPTGWYVRLVAYTPVVTDSLASLTGEPGGNTGYIPPLINRDATQNGWPTIVGPAGSFQARTRTFTFRCTGPGSYPQILSAVLATSSDNTGLLIDATPLKDPRALNSGDTLDLIYRPSLV